MKRCSRLERAEQRGAAEVRLAAGQPQRQVAADLGLARSTLAGPVPAQRRRRGPGGLGGVYRNPGGRALGAPSRAGGALRHHAAGIRLVCEFLELSGLSAFVGAGYGTQQALNAALEEAAVAVARAALAPGMPHRDIAVCEDETFDPHICLVALEPVSGFIPLEQYAADRTTATWTAAL